MAQAHQAQEHATCLGLAHQGRGGARREDGEGVRLADWQRQCRVLGDLVLQALAVTPPALVDTRQVWLSLFRCLMLCGWVPLF